MSEGSEHAALGAPLSGDPPWTDWRRRSLGSHLGPTRARQRADLDPRLHPPKVKTHVLNLASQNTTHHTELMFLI